MEDTHQEHLEAHTEAVVKSGLHIQEEIDRKEASRPPRRTSGEAMQAGMRDYPSSFPRQHLKKPGVEAELEVKPMYDAPYYKGSGELEGMAALITGGDFGILLATWRIAASAGRRSR